MKKVAQEFEFRLIKKDKINKEVYSFYFEKNNFNFKPGQYVRLTLPIIKPDFRGSSRYFTISSSPKDQELMITTKIVKSSFKKKLHSLKKWDVVSAFGPIGYFNFNIKNKKNKILLAGGIGLTPYHSVIKTFKKNKSIKICLIVSFTLKKEIIFYDELKEIEKENPNIRIIYTLTKEKLNGFENGRIDKEMILKYCPDYKKSEFFIVGSVAFEGNFLVILKEMGIKEKNIFSENFPGY